jgi:hypothetical protein
LWDPGIHHFFSDYKSGEELLAIEVVIAEQIADHLELSNANGFVLIGDDDSIFFFEHPMVRKMLPDDELRVPGIAVRSKPNPFADLVVNVL